MRKFVASLVLLVCLAEAQGRPAPSIALDVPNLNGQIPGDVTVAPCALSWDNVPIGDGGTPSVVCYMMLLLKNNNGDWVMQDTKSSQTFDFSPGKWRAVSLYCGQPPDGQQTCKGKVNGWYFYNIGGGEFGLVSTTFDFTCVKTN